MRENGHLYKKLHRNFYVAIFIINIFDTKCFSPKTSGYGDALTALMRYNFFAERGLDGYFL
jgi:hypothetical protein